MIRDFAAFLKQREAASNAYINGDGEPLTEMLTENDPATFMPPSGQLVTGADKVTASHAAGAASFAKGSEGRFEVLSSGSDGSLGYWTGLQPSKVMFAGKSEPMPMTLRVTEVFRFEDGSWKLVHRHADMMKE